MSSTRPPATKHTAAALLHGERSDHLIQGLERAWIRHSRLPQSLCSDEGRGWAGEEMNAWTTQHSVEHIVAHRLATCGARRAIEAGTFEEDLQRRIFRGRHSTRDMFIRAVRRR